MYRSLLNSDIQFSLRLSFGLLPIYHSRLTVIASRYPVPADDILQPTVMYRVLDGIVCAVPDFLVHVDVLCVTVVVDTTVLLSS